MGFYLRFLSKSKRVLEVREIIRVFRESMLQILTQKVNFLTEIMFQKSQVHKRDTASYFNYLIFQIYFSGLIQTK